jgi:hypothetical protein
MPLVFSFATFTTKFGVLHDVGTAAEAVVAPNSATIASRTPDKRKDFFTPMIIFLLF